MPSLSEENLSADSITVQEATQPFRERRRSLKMERARLEAAQIGNPNASAGRQRLADVDAALEELDARIAGIEAEHAG